MSHNESFVSFVLIKFSTSHTCTEREAWLVVHCMHKSPAKLNWRMDVKLIKSQDDIFLWFIRVSWPMDTINTLDMLSFALNGCHNTSNRFNINGEWIRHELRNSLKPNQLPVPLSDQMKRILMSSPKNRDFHILWHIKCRWEMWHCSRSTHSVAHMKWVLISSKGQPVHHFTQPTASHKIYSYDFWIVKFHARGRKRGIFKFTSICIERWMHKRRWKTGERNHYIKFACNCQEITRFIFQFSFTFLSHINTHTHASMPHMPSYPSSTEQRKHRVALVKAYSSENQYSSATILYYLQAGSTSIFFASMDALQIVAYLLSGGDTIILRILHKKISMLQPVYLCAQHSK